MKLLSNKTLTLESMCNIYNQDSHRGEMGEEGENHPKFKIFIIYFK